MASVRDLVADIEACWNDVRREVEGFDLGTSIYPDPTWTMRDVLVHCAFWNDEAVTAIEAFRRGAVYVTDTGTPSYKEGIDALNNRVVEAARGLSDVEVMQRWVDAQDRFTEAVRALNDADLDREMTCPWDDRMSVEAMVRSELGHETSHIDDIVTAVSAQEE